MTADNHKRPSLPALDINTGFNHSPHVVILGAGASRACCPKGDRDGNVLPVMKDLVATLGAEKVLADHGIDKPDQDFEALYTDIHNAGNTTLLHLLEERTSQYFQSIEIPESPTLYDYLLLTLRGKDLIATFNWDPLLVQAYKRCRSLCELPHIAFLHGNVAIGANYAERKKAFIGDEKLPDDATFEPTPLLYPVQNKDYQKNDFIRAEWELTTDLLKRAYFVTVIGYSAPVTDTEAKKLLLDAWTNNPSQRLAELEIIDIAERDHVEKMWEEFFVGTHYSIFDSFDFSILKRHPRRSCEAFAFATLQQAPWHEERLPEFSELHELASWILPFVEEESSGRLNGKPHWEDPS